MFYTWIHIFQVTENMSLYKEEIFGPVVSIKTFQTEEEALALANDSRYTYTQQTMRPMKLKKD